MTRPTPGSPFPYTRGDVVRMTGTSDPQVKKLSAAVLKKRAKGTGNFLGFNLDDALRIAVARELMRAGVAVGAIHSLFHALETPPVSRGKTWAWLRSAEVHVAGAAIVLLLPRPLAARDTAHVFLTTAIEAAAWLKQPKRTVIVIDVGALIEQLEAHSGQRYGAPPDASSAPVA